MLQGRVIAASANLKQGGKLRIIGRAMFVAIACNVARRIIARASHQIAALRGPYLGRRHFVFSQRAGLVCTNHRCGAQRFDRLQPACQRIFFDQSGSAQRDSNRDDSR